MAIEMFVLLMVITTNNELVDQNYAIAEIAAIFAVIGLHVWYIMNQSDDGKGRR